MKNFLLALAALTFFACSSDKGIKYSSDGKVSRINFSIKDSSKLYYSSKSLFYQNNSDQVRFKDSATLTYKLQSTDHNLLKWILTPGSLSKEIPDTMYYENLQSGVFCRYNKELYDGADKNSLMFPLPLEKGQTWNTNFFTYNAVGKCIAIDTTLKTLAGDLQCIGLEYSFSPDYMNDFVKDTASFEMQAIVRDFISAKGKVISTIDYFVVEKKNTKNKWKILSNETLLNKVSEN